MANDFLTPGVALPSAGGSTTNQGAVGQPTTFSWDDNYQRYSYFALIGFTALLVYSYWNMLESTSAFWARDQYSHGWIMPLVAIYLMWSRRPNPAAHDPKEGQGEATFLNIVPASIFLKGSLAAGAALVALGYFLLSSPMLQGAGIAVICLGAMAYVLIGQPFDRIADTDRWIGLAILLAGYGVRILLAAEFEIEPLNRVSFILAMFGLFLMIGGWKLILWAGPAIGFLLFMFPIPTVIERPLLLTLQKVAAVASEIVLTILGLPVVREGYKIVVDGVPLEVAEACSGLRMLTIFGGLALAVALLIRRPWWDRFVIILSALPIALIVNIVRIVVTALLYTTFPDNEIIHQIVHDFAGIAMMPLALGLLYLELKLLSMLSTPEESIQSHATNVGSFAAR